MCVNAYGETKPFRSAQGQISAMKRFFHSLGASIFVAGVVLTFTTTLLARKLPRTVGPPDITENRSFVLQPAQRLHVSNVDGSVRVDTHLMDEIRVTATIKAYTRAIGDKTAQQEYTASLVRISENEGTLEITTESRPRPDGVELSVDYALRVPEGANLVIDNENGEALIGQGCGDVTVRGRNVDIGIENPSGDVEAVSTNGRIRLSGSRQLARLNTANGNVWVRAYGGSVNAATVNGAIEGHIMTPDVEACSLTTQNGHITLVLCEGCSIAIEATTMHGAIRVDAPTDFANGVQRRDYIRGTIGGGERRFSLETLNGDIWLTRSLL